jgi:tetratricopeptide (TPR) repeat protein/transglutaminase-like putative cysteine protease
MTRWVTLSSWAFLCASLSFARNPVPPHSPSPADYSREASVIESYRTTANYENDGTGTHSVELRARVQSDAGVQQYGLLQFAYSSAGEEVGIDYVRVHKPDGTVVETPPESVQDLPAQITIQAPFYTDYHEKHVPVKGLAPGDVLEYRVHIRTLKPLIPGQFWYADDFLRTGIVLDEELEISVPKDREVRFRSPDVKPAVREEGARRIYLWKTSNLEEKPRQEVLPGSAAPPSVLLSSFRSWEELGNWWNGLAQPQVTPTPEVRAKAAELTRNANSETEKINALYDFVATRCRYIGVAFGIGRYEPHAAGEVFKNGYGDCKDKHTLLASLLQAAGIPSYPVLISSLRKTDPEVASPAQFDHVITAVPQGGGMVWLDTTPEVAPFGYLTLNLRDKLALIVPPGKPAYLAQTIAAPPFAPFATVDVKGKLTSDGTLQAHFQQSVRGGVEVLVRSAFRRTSQAQWKDLVQNIAQFQGYGGTVGNVSATAPEATSGPFTFSYDYTRKDFSDWEHYQILSALPGFGLPPASDDPAKAGQPIILGEPTDNHFHSEIELPEGFTPVLPHSATVSNRVVDFSASYAFKDGVMTTDYRLKLKRSIVAPGQVADYREAQKIIDLAPRLYTQLLPGPGAKTLAASTPRARAEELLRYAQLAYSQRNFPACLKYLHQATQADPQFAEAWVALAALLAQTDNVNESAAAYRQAIELTPDNRNNYAELARLFKSHDRPDEAIAVWRDLLKHQPADTEAHTSLAELLLAQKRYREAISDLEALNDPNHPNPSVAMRLAEAYLGAGENDKGTEIFRRMAAADPRPETLTDVAMKLAEANVDLANAQAYAEKAVQAEELASAQVSIDEEGTGGIENTRDLAKSWDALGWVNFRQGSFAKAQNYLRAAWMLALNPAAADHLGQLYERQGKKESAIQMYAAAVAISKESRESRQRLEHMAGDRYVAMGAVNAAHDRLYQVQVIRAAGASTPIGSGEFVLLFSKGPKVEQVRLLSGPSGLKVFAKAIAATKFDVPFPDDGPTRLVHSGTLSCGKYSGCTFVLMPLNTSP